MAITSRGLGWTHSLRGALVGRDNELDELGRALDRVAGDEPWSVQIAGEPGIGKSRLLAELCRLGERRGYLVLDGRAAEFERDIPFGLIVDALNDYLGSLEPSMVRAFGDDVLSELASVFPSLPRPDVRLEGSERRPDRYRMHYAVRSGAPENLRHASRSCSRSTTCTGRTRHPWRC